MSEKVKSCKNCRFGRHLGTKCAESGTEVPIIEHGSTCDKHQFAEVVGCYCLINDGELHCPLTTEREDLEKTFNYKVRGERIAYIEVNKDFVCHNERNKDCEHCPFK